MIGTSGYEHTFLVFGLIQGGVTFLTGLLLSKPDARLLPATKAKVVQTRREYSPWEMLKSPVFWVMYVMFVLVAAGGLLIADAAGATAGKALGSRAGRLPVRGPAWRSPAWRARP